MRRFIVDAMLGKLALWLRLTGNDTLYSTDMNDDELLAISEREGRVLLTSDETLVQMAENTGLESMLLRGHVDERIACVFHKYGIPARIDPDLSRCSKCNGELTEIKGEEKQTISGLVPEQTYDHYDIFWLCDSCGSVFFQGGQWSNMQSYMRRIDRLVQTMRD